MKTVLREPSASDRRTVRHHVAGDRHFTARCRPRRTGGSGGHGGRNAGPVQRRAGYGDGAAHPAALGAAAAGVITCFSFPPWGWWPLAFVGVAALALIVRGRRCKTAYGLGIAYALGFLLPLLVWSKVAGVDAWIILTVSQSLLLAVIGPLCVLAQRRRFSPLWIAGAWMVEEAVRDRVPFGGFPWGRLAFSQSDSPLTGLAAWGGAPLLSFAVALGGGLLVAAVPVVAGRQCRSARRHSPPAPRLRAWPRSSSRRC